jgi:DNA-binding transcriptional regulator YdaS (Cro superfamily)
MAKNKNPSDKAKAARESTKKTTLLDELQPGEAALVLRRLLAGHPELVPEAEAISRSTLGGVSLESVASEVEDAVRQFAQQRKTTIGQVISQLARQALEPKSAPRMRNGVLLFDVKPGAKKPNMALVNRLRDEE